MKIWEHWMITFFSRVHVVLISYSQYHFYKSVFRQGVLLYGDVCPFGSPTVRVFRTFLPHALTYWTEILRITLFFMHVRSGSNAINSCWLLQELCPSWTSNTCKYNAVFRTFLLHALKYWVEVLCMTVLMYSRSSLNVITMHKFLNELCIWICFYISHIKFECRQCVRLAPSVRPFSALFSYMHWQIELKL